MSEQELTPGIVFHEKYQVIRLLAKGGMGAVYEVLHTETQRKRALKVMLPSVVKSEDMRDRFRAEARVASAIESEHIVETFDAGVDRATGMPFLVMEFLKGQELADAISKQGRLPAEQAIPILGQVSRTLDRTHAARVVHRDLKPENLFLSTREDGSMRVKILDFGIAKIVAEGEAGGTKTLGTPLYMAPEQFDGSSPISAQTDLFAMAHIAYTVLVGVPYWNDEQGTSPSLYGFLMTTQQGIVEPPSQRAARRGVQLPAAFDAWFMRAAARSPATRFPSAGEQQAALEMIFFGRRITIDGANQPFSGAQPSGAMPAVPSGTVAAGPAMTSFAAAGVTGAGATNPGAYAPGATPKKSSALPIVIALLVLVLGGGAAAFFLFFKKDTAAASDDKSSAAKEDKDTTAPPTPSATPPTAPSAVVANTDEIQFVKSEPAVGSFWEAVETSDFRVSFPAAKHESVTTERSVKRFDVFSADGKKILKLKVHYKEQTKTEKTNGVETVAPVPTAGKTYIAEYKDDDIVITDEKYEAVSAEEQALVEKDVDDSLGKADPMMAAISTIPMKRGARADSLADSLRAMLAEPGSEMKLSEVTVTLSDIQIVDGVKHGIFDVKMKAVAEKSEEGAQEIALTMDLAGTITIRADNSNVAKVALKGPLKITGTVEGTGTANFVEEYKR